MKVYFLSVYNPSQVLSGEDTLNNVAGVERRSGVVLCLNPAAFKNCEGEASYEAMTSDLTTVTESADTNGHLL